MDECRDRVEKTRLLNLKGHLDQLTKQMPVRLENKSKRRQRAKPVRFEDEEEESDTWPDSIAPMVQPREDEEAGAEGDDATGQEEARRGARGVIKEETKEAETQRREKVPLADKVGVQTRSKR